MKASNFRRTYGYDAKTYDETVTLINKGHVSDAYGVSKPVSARSEPVLCCVRSVGRAEFYAAGEQGLKPEIIVCVHFDEYLGENMFEVDGVLYSVVRTYRVGNEEIELYGERKAGER